MVKKVYRKKRKVYNKKRRTNKSLTSYTPHKPLSTSIKTITRYSDFNVTMNPGIGGAAASYVFSLNGLYDPDITGGGHQPIGFDQLISMYDHYTVIYAKATVIFSNQDPTYSQIVALQIKDTNTTTTDMDNVLENAGTVYTVVTPNLTGGQTKQLSISCAPSAFFGKKVMGSTTYQGSMNSNPSDQVFLHCITQPQFVNDTSEVRASVLIEYTAVFTEPKTLAGS